MSYFRYIDNGEGPTKLFIGGLHGNEGVTSLKSPETHVMMRTIIRTILFLQLR